MPWCPSPVVSDRYITSVPASVPSYDWYDFTMTPSSSFADTSYAVINLSTFHGVSTDTTTVSVVKPRASVPTFGGPQQSSFCPMCPTVQPPTAVSTSLLSSSNLVPVQHPPQGLAMPTVPTGLEGQVSNLSLSSVSLGVTQPPLISSVPGSGVPTTAVTDQRPVMTNPWHYGVRSGPFCCNGIPTHGGSMADHRYDFSFPVFRHCNTVK